MRRQTAQGNTAEVGQNTSESGLSPELVRQVADRVYAMLRRDLQIERERRRLFSGGSQRRQSEDR